MSKMKELYEKVAQDNALQAKFAEIMNRAEASGEEATKQKLLVFAKEAGFDVTVEEMQEFFRAKTEAVGELSDSELDQVAGGKAGGIGFSVITLGVGCALVSAGLELSAAMSCKEYFHDA